jgi:prephenate dehydrogenase
MPPFKKIVIFGVGLIGGSFALALKKAGVVEQVVGVGRRLETLERAKSLGIIDAIGDVTAVSDADLVLIATPVAQTQAVLASIAPYLQAHTVVTDAGSTKSDVVAAARLALGEKIAQFVPGHPIAGREQNGPEAALADLYVGKKVVLTALPENASALVASVSAAWKHCGALIHELSAEEPSGITWDLEKFTDKGCELMIPTDLSPEFVQVELYWTLRNLMNPDLVIIKKAVFNLSYTVIPGEGTTHEFNSQPHLLP